MDNKSSAELIVTDFDKFTDDLKDFNKSVSQALLQDEKSVLEDIQKADLLQTKLRKTIQENNTDLNIAMLATQSLLVTLIKIATDSYNAKNATQH